ncbi:hypothetical protein ACIBL5_12715 [Streptomyces sp. NPDC050516]|uniref:hypothetical protein n=1 Tax=Streptomyces sp. NPDC050516 TaxID=3365621 RepID=UPI0037B47EF2
MLTRIANGDSRPSFWLRVREFAVPPSMIETATARRSVGDWAGACAAAGVDVDLDVRSVARTHGQELAAQLRADLRQLVPDLLRWHMPRVAPDGLLRPGLTIALAKYGATGPGGASPVHLVARTAPAWADAGQRISLALWGGSRHGSRFEAAGASRHPHPHPHPRFRLDLHRHLWDARRTDELRMRSGADGHDGPGGRDASGGPDEPPAGGSPVLDPAVRGAVPPGHRCALSRWAPEAAIVLRAEGRSTGAVTVRLGSRSRPALELVTDPDGLGPPTLRLAAGPPDANISAPPVLPDAATWELPDLDLLRTGSIEADRLHPLVASALVPDHAPPACSRAPDRSDRPRLVECRGEQHRIGLVDGVLVPLDHDPAEIRREELLVALTGTPLPCLRVIDEAHRRPECLVGVRERLDHGDIAGALAVVEQLLGPEAVLRSGALRDELEAAAQRRITYGLYRSELIGPGPGRLHPGPSRPSDRRSHPRHTQAR